MVLLGLHGFILVAWLVLRPAQTTKRVGRGGVEERKKSNRKGKKEKENWQKIDFRKQRPGNGDERKVEGDTRA